MCVCAAAATVCMLLAAYVAAVLAAYVADVLAAILQLCICWQYVPI